MTAETSGGPGQAIIAWSWRGTVLFSATAVGATVFEALRPVAAAVALSLFAIGCVVFLVAFGTAVERSRVEAIGIGGLYFLVGSAPSTVQRSLLGSVVVEVVVGLVTAGIRMFTSLAFGTLVPMFGLGLAGLWAARYGRFGSRGMVADES
jgi:hypothetical protein